MNRSCNRHGRGRFRDNKEGRYIFGIVLVAAGALLLASKAGFFIPKWLLSWPMILIVVGLAVGANHHFRGTGWIWPLGIGSFFLAEKIFPGFFPRDYAWPALLVLFGLVIIFKPRNSRFTNYPPQAIEGEEATEGVYQDRLDDSTIFGTVRKVIVSKNFKGGEVSTVFGNAEINLLQADFDTPPKLELNAVFGGIRLIVPSHWQLKMENSAVLGGVEDKRPQHAIYSDKILYLEANAVFGGIQIATA